jgi:Sec-independent protein translocase protein TatA
MINLEKIQKLPVLTRKAILWIVIIIISAGLLAWYIKSFREKIKNFKTEEFKKDLQLPSFKEELKNFPGIEIPKINEENINEVDEQLKQNEEKIEEKIEDKTE